MSDPHTKAAEMLRPRLAEHLDRITALFKRGVKVTLVVRTPGRPERDVIMTDDDLNEAIEAIERLRDEPAISIPPDPAA